MANHDIYDHSPAHSNLDAMSPNLIGRFLGSPNSVQDKSPCLEDYSFILDGISFHDLLPPTPMPTLSPSTSTSTSLESADEKVTIEKPPSVEELVRIAASKFIQSRSNDFHIYSGKVATELSEEDSESVELAGLLLEAAASVGDGQLGSASILLHQIDQLCSPSGNPVQRLVFYYSRALRGRVDQETGRAGPSEVRKGSKEQSSDLYRVVMTPSLPSVEYHRKIPFSQVAQFAGIQSIVEHVAKSKKIHIIDFGMRNGQQWIILMQALASRKRRRVEHLKITAVVTLGKQLIEQTGRRLLSFAQGINLPSSFHVVSVHDLAQLTRDDFEVEADETVAVLAEYIANTLTKPVDRLDSVIRAVKSLYPTVMVVSEMEANTNSPAFVNRFVESLFLASAFFDCYEDCMDREEPARKYGECTLFGEASKAIVAIRGEERFIRNMKADVWRVYFRRVGMVEAVLSPSSLYQAELVAKKVPSWGGCTVGMDGKSLIVGWKGTPIVSVTAWKFT